jgi:hypothetical protein
LLVAYATEVGFAQVAADYINYFHARGVRPTLRAPTWMLFDYPSADLCMRIQRWDEGTGVPYLRLMMSADQERVMDGAHGSYWVSLPDDCNNKG